MLIAWERLSRMLRDYANTPPSRRNEFHDTQKWLSEDLASYIALFEFSEVSNQLQGLELFTRIPKNRIAARLSKNSCSRSSSPATSNG